MADSDKLIGIFPETGQSGLLPRIEFTGKDNKKITLQTEDNNDLHFVNASGESLLKITTSGVIGANSLQVNSTGVSLIGHTHTAYDITNFASSVSGLLPVGTANYLSKFGTGGSGLINSLVFDNGTNIGIGTSTPLEQLHVVNNIRLNSSTTNSVITINPSGRSINVSPSQFSDIILQVNDQNIFRGLDNWTATWADSVVTTYFQVGRSGGNTIFTSLVGNPFNRLAYSANKYLFTNQTSNISVPSPYFNIEYNGSGILAATTTGNIGIGTASPSTKLDVSGVITATGGDSTQWNTAYGWGDHASAGYLSATGGNITNNLTIGGNLTVNGDTVVANVSSMEIEDPILTLGLASGNIITDDSYDRGIAMVTNNGTAFMGWDNSADRFVLLSSGVATNGSGNYDAGVYGDLMLNRIYGGSGNAFIQFNIAGQNRIDISSDTYVGSTTLIGTQSLFLNSPQLYANSSLQFPKTGTAVSTATQKNSHSIILYNSMWNGSSELQTDAAIQSIASTSVNTRSRLAFLTSNEDGTNNKVERLSIVTDGNVGIGTTDPAAKLDIRTSGVPGFVVQTSNSQNTFQYLKFDGNNLLRASFDGSNFHHYLGARLYYNIGTNGVTFDGGGGTNQSSVGFTNRAYIALNSSSTSAPGSANIHAGPTAYAASDYTLTSITPFAFTTWAWNGSNGYSINSHGYMKQVQNSTTAGDARLSIARGSDNSELFTVNYLNGNVGIGTTTPSQALQVGPTTPTGATPYALLNGLRIGGGDTSNTIWNAGRDIAISRDSGGLISLSQTSVRTIGLTVNTTNGNVGLGTTSAGTILSLQRSDTTSYAGNHTTITNNGIDIYNNQSSVTDAFAGISFRVAGSGYTNVGAGSINLVNTGDGDGDLTFVTRNNGTSSEKLRIAYDGKVGIGTSSPGHKLTVDGVSTTAISIKTPWAANAYGQLRFDTGTGSASIRSNVPGNSTLGLEFYTYSGGAESVKMSILGDGKVGIGLTDPDEKLEVNGNIHLAANGILYFGVAGTNTKIIDDNGSNRTVLMARGDTFDIINAAGNGFSATLRTGIIAGGSTATNNLVLKSTTGVGTTDYISLAVGNNGGTEGIRIINNGNVGIGTATPSYKLQVNGSFGATTKSFRIDHPSRPNYTLEYGSLESPYHGVRLTGRGRVVKGSGVVVLPPYLKDLIHDDETINIQITNIKHGKTIYVDKIDLNNDQFTVRVDRAKTLGTLEFFWTFTGTRKDVDKLVVEAEK